MADALKAREDAVASKEGELKEYAAMKHQWAVLKSKVASQDARLSSATEEIEAKETYIRKLIKKERDTAASLMAANRRLELLESAEQRAAALEKEKEETAERLRVEEARVVGLQKMTEDKTEELKQRESAAAEAAKLTMKLSEELDTMREQQRVFASAEAEQSSVRQREAAALAASVEVAEAEKAKLEKELAFRSDELRSHQERERMLDRALDARDAELNELKAANSTLEAAREAAEEAVKLKAAVESESSAREKAEADLSCLADLVNSMKEQVAALESKEDEERLAKEAKEAAVLALSDDLERASRETRQLTNRLESLLLEKEQAEATVLATDERTASLELAVAEAQTEASRRRLEAESACEQLRTAQAKICASADLEVVVESLTQTATELRVDLEKEMERTDAAAASEYTAREDLESGRAAAVQAAVAAERALLELEEASAVKIDDLHNRLQAESKAVVAETERAAAAEQQVRKLEEQLRLTIENAATQAATAASAVASRISSLEGEARAALAKAEACAAEVEQRDNVGAFLGATATSGSASPENDVDGFEALEAFGDSEQQHGAVWAMVEDWLARCDFKHTVDCLQSERQLVQFKPLFTSPSSATAHSQSQETSLALLSAFDEGRAGDFEDLWASHVPPSLSHPETARDNDAYGNGEGAFVRRLLIKVYAHFCLQPLRARLGKAKWEPMMMESNASRSPVRGRGRQGQVAPGDDDLASFPATRAEEDALIRFRARLADADDALSADPELLPLFALPQLARPWAHPQISPLLAKSAWSKDLRADLSRLLCTRLLLARPPALLVLHRAYSTWQCLAQNRCRRLAVQLNTCRDVGGQLIALAAHATVDLAAATQHPPAPTRLPVDRYRRALNALRKLWQGIGDDGANPFLPPPLDVPRIAGALKLGGATDEAVLLRAVGDRLGCVASKYLRDSTADEFVTGDIFSLHGLTCGPNDGSLLPLLSGPNAALCVRIVALLVSREAGRHYFCFAARDGGEALVRALVAVLGDSSPATPPSLVSCACLALAELMFPAASLPSHALRELVARRGALSCLLTFFRVSFVPSLVDASSETVNKDLPQLGQCASSLLISFCQEPLVIAWCAEELKKHSSGVDVVGEMIALFKLVTRQHGHLPPSATAFQQALTAGIFCLVSHPDLLLHARDIDVGAALSAAPAVRTSRVLNLKVSLYPIKNYDEHLFLRTSYISVCLYLEYLQASPELQWQIAVVLKQLASGESPCPLPPRGADPSLDEQQVAEVLGTLFQLLPAPPGASRIAGGGGAAATDPASLGLLHESALAAFRLAVTTGSPSAR